MGERVARVDFAATIEIGDTFGPPSPGHAPAIRTSEKYLVVDALIARDGLLRYSDGTTSWDEYRPRAELERAAESWRGSPVTDDHPTRMVDSSTWAQVAKGVHLGAPSVEVHDGVGYLRARLLIADAALIAKIDAGQRQLSIGFTADVVRAPGGIAADGTRCDAVQQDLVGNHTASVQRGRAGPACRVLLDSAAWCVYTSPGSPSMTTPAKSTRDPKIDAALALVVASVKDRKDAAGTPVTETEITGPEGTPLTVPTWLAAIYEAWQAAQKGADPLAPPAEPMAEAAAAPAAAPAPAMPKPDAAPAAPAAAPAVPKPEDDPLKDAEREFAPIRRKLDRLAIAAGVDAATFDSPDPRVLARAYITKILPTAKVDSLDARQLVALVETASTIPAPATAAAPATPWDLSAPKPKADAAGDAPSVPNTFLANQGY